MRYILFAILFFGLPHLLWIPLRFGFDSDSVPLGLGNLILLGGGALWLVGKLTGSPVRNPFRAYTVLIAVTVAWTGVALWTGLSPGWRATLTPAKQQVVLMMLYFVPLATLRGSRDFKVVAVIAMAVHALIGYEVLKTGVLGGSAFNDSKRGSGPFGVGWVGADVAGAYLAQTMMFAVGALIGRGVPLIARSAAGAMSAVMMLGIFATYSRGALLAVVAGVLTMVVARGVRLGSVVLVAMLGLAAIVALPGGMRTRLDTTIGEDGAVDESTEGRFVYYRLTWEIVKDYPLGVGTGQARAAMAQRLWFVDPHNSFLQALLESSVVGLVVLLVTIGVAVRGAFEVSRDSNMAWPFRTYGLGAAGFLGCLVVCNLFYSNLYKDLVLGTVALHLGLLAWVCAQRETLAEEDGAENAEED